MGVSKTTVPVLKTGGGHNMSRGFSLWVWLDYIKLK